MEKLRNQREYTVILIWCQAILFNFEIYLVMDFVSLCRSKKFNYLKLGGGEVLKTCHIERHEKSCISVITNILRFNPTVEKTEWISDFLLNMQACLSKNYIKIEE